ncbi:MAG TPA: endonuclease/exonuclease/phosphatase family protein [Phycisphaerae bacterium]|jgi:endonuclease/exonuclease/phosphatase family metal-dependent hydrolase
MILFKNHRRILPRLAACLLLGYAVRLNGQIVVNTTGYFDPDGSTMRPFSVVEAGLCAVGSGATVSIASGDYHETFASGAPATLTSSGGMVTIGSMGTDTTTLKVVSYNTHLFGTVTGVNLPSPFPDLALESQYFLDGDRAHRIGIRLHIEDADVVGLQEVWDPPLEGIIAMEAAYPSGFYGGGEDPYSWNGLPVPFTINSGLFMMSKFPLTNVQQVSYVAESGFVESLASKGYLRATFVKDGFSIGWFDTHTQSGDASDADIFLTRQLQLIQLASAVQIYRINHPSHIVIVNGDFNVVGESSEYTTTMRSQMGGLGHVRDGARNERCSPEMTTCTSCLDNELRLYFYPDETTQSRLDYILYAPSLDGTADIVPLTYERRLYRTPPGLPDLSYNGLTTDELSDHYGIFVEFRLIHQ